MGWIRISDDFYDNDKISDVGPLGLALHVAAVGFCNRNLTDGFIKKNKTRMLLDFDGIGVTTATADMCSFGVDGEEAAKLVIGWMVAADLFHEKGHGCDECHARDDGGEPTSREYLVHNYLKFQPSKAEVEEKAEANRKRVEAWRESRKDGGNAVSNSVGNALHTSHVQEQYAASTNPPTPTPTPSSFLVETLGGEVAKRNARDTPRPHCSKHRENSETEKCRACKRRREWDDAQAELVESDQLEAQRQKKTREAQQLKACVDCDEEGWRYDDREIKCRHQEAV